MSYPHRVLLAFHSVIMPTFERVIMSLCHFVIVSLWHCVIVCLGQSDLAQVYHVIMCFRPHIKYSSRHADIVSSWHEFVMQCRLHVFIESYREAIKSLRYWVAVVKWHIFDSTRFGLRFKNSSNTPPAAGPDHFLDKIWEPFVTLNLTPELPVISVTALRAILPPIMTFISSALLPTSKHRFWRPF